MVLVLVCPWVAAIFVRPSLQRRDFYRWQTSLRTFLANGFPFLLNKSSRGKKWTLSTSCDSKYYRLKHVQQNLSATSWNQCGRGDSRGEEVTPFRISKKFFLCSTPQRLSQYLWVHVSTTKPILLFVSVERKMPRDQCSISEVVFTFC